MCVCVSMFVCVYVCVSVCVRARVCSRLNNENITFTIAMKRKLSSYITEYPIVRTSHTPLIIISGKPGK